jgi:hypothetical protein
MHAYSLKRATADDLNAAAALFFQLGNKPKFCP